MTITPVVVTGQPGVGKSTISGLLAARRDVAAHVKADDLHRMIVSGRAWPSAGTDAAHGQLLARTRSAAQLAHNLARAGVQPFIDEVVALPDQVDILDSHLESAHWVLLSASPAVVRQRDASRARHTAEAYLDLGRTVAALLAERATVIDTDGLSPEETVPLVEAALAQPAFEGGTRGPVWWLVEVTVAPEHVAVFEVLTREMLDAAREEAATLAYERYRVDNTTFHFHERYESSAAALRHLERFRLQFAERLSAVMTRRRFHLYGPVTSELRASLDPFGAIATGPWPP